jgi:hypothetical protein
MREVWNLPGEEEFKFTGPDWLLILLILLAKGIFNSRAKFRRGIRRC